MEVLCISHTNVENTYEKKKGKENRYKLVPHEDSHF